MSGERRFGCPYCQHDYKAYPPDDHYTEVASDEEVAKNNAFNGKIKKTIRDCENCFKPITLYWYHPKIAFAVGRF
jgi:hypothetical protein